MRTRLLVPSEQNLELAAAALRAGALVAFPTDTVYGLAALYCDEVAVARIYQAKERGEGKPIALLLATAADLSLVAARVDEPARRLAARFWPGALTLVVPASARVPIVVRAGGPNVGLRVPDHPLALSFIRRVGAPLATTSANRSGQGSLLTAEAVRQELDGRIDFIIEGSCPGGVESTVVDLSVSPPAILREGAISRAEVSGSARQHFLGGEAMKVAIGADHVGYDLKAEVSTLLTKLGHECLDFSPPVLDPEDDYPVVSAQVAKAVAQGEVERGIIICGTGIGVSITANKVDGVRAALCGDTFSAHSSREHNNANVLCLGARVLGVGLALDIVQTWLGAEFSTEERHHRRVSKIGLVETTGGC